MFRRKHVFGFFFIHVIRQNSLGFFNIINRLSFLFYCLFLDHLNDIARNVLDPSLLFSSLVCFPPPYIFCELADYALLPRSCSFLLSPTRSLILISVRSFRLLMSVIVINVFRLREYIFFFE